MHAGRGLLQEPVEQAFAGEVARDSLSRLTAAQNLAAAEAAAAAKPIVTPATTTPATPAGGELRRYSMCLLKGCERANQNKNPIHHM